MRTTGDHRKKTALRTSIGALYWCALAVLCTACSSPVPNVRPFADGTTVLYQANGAETQAVLSMYDDTIALSKKILKQSEVRLVDDSRTRIKKIRDDLIGSRASYETSAKVFDAVLQQAVMYSERLAELAAAGETGAEAAQSLAGTINQFGALAGSANLITGPVVAMLKQIANYHTRIKARKNLHAAALAAQDAVADIATALKHIHSGALQSLVSGLSAYHDQLLVHEAGASIIGYYREANDRRDMFYRRALLTLRTSNDGISGFCHNPDTGEVDPDCMTVREIQALKEIEHRLAALKPEFEMYQSKRDALRAWRHTRRINGALLVKAVDTWVVEHRNAVDALRDGAGVSAFSLRAILADIQSY